MWNFLWNASNMSDKPPVEGAALKITIEMVSKAINKVKADKAAGPSGIITEMIKAANNEIIDCITSLFNHIVYNGRVPNDIYHISSIFSKEKEILYLVRATEALNYRTMQ